MVQLQGLRGLKRVLNADPALCVFNRVELDPLVGDRGGQLGDDAGDTVGPAAGVRLVLRVAVENFLLQLVVLQQLVGPHVVHGLLVSDVLAHLLEARRDPRVQLPWVNSADLPGRVA